MNINNCIADTRKRIPVSYTLELDAAMISALPEERSNVFNYPAMCCCYFKENLFAQIKISALHTMAGLVSPVAGTIGCLRNIFVCQPKAAIFDLINGIRNCLFVPCKTPYICMCGISQWDDKLSDWHFKYKWRYKYRQEGSFLKEVIFNCCVDCYPEKDKKIRNDKCMGLLNRSYFKIMNTANISDYETDIFINILGEAINTNDQNTLDFLEIRQVFQDKKLFKLPFVLFCIYTSEMLSDPVKLSNFLRLYDPIEIRYVIEKVDSLSKSMFYFLKNNPLLIYEFENKEIEFENPEAGFKNKEQQSLLTFKKFSCIYKFEEISLHIVKLLNDQIKIFEESINKPPFPKVLRNLITEYTEPYGIRESEEEKNERLEKERENAIERKVEIELDPEKNQVME